jgi:hypothetical protein
MVSKENLERIVHELAFGSRKTKVNLIKDLASDEYETTDSVFELASKTDEQINADLSHLFDYFLNEYEEEVENSVQRFC